MPGMEWKGADQLLYNSHEECGHDLYRPPDTDRRSFETSVGLGRPFAPLMSGFLQIWFLVASFGMVQY